MQYVILVEQKRKAPEMYTAPVAPADADYLVQAAKTLKPLSEEDYIRGPAAILHMLAHFSYVLVEDDVFWCVEWMPGLIVIRFSPDGKIAWTALRSPVPDFGGRTPSDADQANFDKEAPNHQVNLVFEPWSAQFDPEDRELKGFRPADQDAEARFEAALDRVNQIGQQIEQKYANDLEAWVYRGEEEVAKMVGDGISLA